MRPNSSKFHGDNQFCQTPTNYVIFNPAFNADENLPKNQRLETNAKSANLKKSNNMDNGSKRSKMLSLWKSSVSTCYM